MTYTAADLDAIRREGFVPTQPQPVTRAMNPAQFKAYRLIRWIYREDAQLFLTSREDLCSGKPVPMIALWVGFHVTFIDREGRIIHP